ncbi:hypothetical protein E9549_03335 [Blastococcus sp. MG754426]|uniref:hypothetical protein n=1 Tax=unclassified Blastococcus TaxID=2619396 RepID=UPI001EF0B0DF|nr:MULTISPECIES: hypothetical protein [unclassified Blastococcus]MCF6506444.1 hypothetical protein [Blastococcus sp. MG754426]MCF6511271.1 hypothetical protein [Blastococcus sp. MG754427]
MTGFAPPAPREVLAGDRVIRVGWLPGSDRLRGRCHCGAESEAEDPILLWDWLVAHPAHPVGGPALPEPPDVHLPPPAHLVADPALVRRRPTVPA